jgi:hypothetical protein
MTTVEGEGREAEIEPFPIQNMKISKYIGGEIYEASRLHGNSPSSSMKSKGPVSW